ncbi:tyrosine-type recombinase/integrase [Zunongwangia sp. H14]|uniref:tyrosine-type recombinase/integrase n=1 Tax=Zunongwangia sp. H14 TaxID=3240792 RepID=UPI00356AE790
MKKIKLFGLRHRDKLQIGISFIYDLELKEHLMQLPDVKWSNTNKVFYILYSPENLNTLLNHLNDELCEIEKEELEAQVQKAKAPRHPELGRLERKYLWQYVDYLRGKRYSESTVKTYYSFILKFLKFNKKPLAKTGNREISIFFEQEIAKRNYSISTHRQCMSALIHFVELNNMELINKESLSRPKKSRILPTILSQREAIELLIATKNLKHRAILALIYSSGLRIGEVLKLKLTDLDMDRRQIFVSQAKGRKDRYVGMADTFVPILYNYLKTYQPKKRFVEGYEDNNYSASAIRSFLKKSCRRAKINKRVTPHTLRHSYATHMLENGVSLRHIQELLGHSKPETTMIYTHVTQMDLLRIQSPMDVAVKALLQNDNEDQKLRLSRN